MDGFIRVIGLCKSGHQMFFPLKKYRK